MSQASARRPTHRPTPRRPTTGLGAWVHGAGALATYHATSHAAHTRHATYMYARLYMRAARPPTHARSLRPAALDHPVSKFEYVCQLSDTSGEHAPMKAERAIGPRENRAITSVAVAATTAGQGTGRPDLATTREKTCQSSKFDIRPRDDCPRGQQGALSTAGIDARLSNILQQNITHT